MTNTDITKGLKIVKTKGLRFGSLSVSCERKGYAIYHEGFGYLSFRGQNREPRYGIKTPYIPCGGKGALQTILDGGLDNYDCIEWLQPIATTTEGAKRLAI